jgi:glycerol-3-phosphate acyltransferase PlsY
MNVWIAALAAAAGYFLGSVSFARLVSRWVAPETDITDLKVAVLGTDEAVDVGVVGANAASMILGPRVGCAVALMDMLKVALPMLAFRFIFPDQVYFLIVSVAGLIGHNWPIYYQWAGGRGFSVIFASFLIVDWLGPVVTVIVGLLLGMVVFRNLMLAYGSWLWLMIPWIWLRTHDPVYLGYVIVVNLIFAIATLPETRTILRYRREGKLEAYLDGLTASSPRWRGMKKLADRLDVFRRAR